ncbi:hypothetical protein HDU98_009744, partial [Podochytrium sp. JEL0797]
MLNDRIMHVLASKHRPSGAEMTAEEYDVLKMHQQQLEDDFNPDEMEEEQVEEITEMQLLGMMDEEEDSLLVARRLIRQDIVSLEEGMEVLERRHLEMLFETGFVAVDGLVELDAVHSAKMVAIGLAESGGMVEAAESGMKEDDDVIQEEKPRDDLICWLNKGQYPAVNPALESLVERMEQIQRDLSKVIKLKGIVEYQLSVFKGNGGRYVRHRDAFPVDDEEDD